MNNTVLNNEIKTFTCIFTDGTQKSTIGTDKYLADEYFKPERQGHKSDYYSLGDTFNYCGNIYMITSVPREYIDSNGYLIVYCKVEYYDYRAGKTKTGYGVETFMRRARY